MEELDPGRVTSAALNILITPSFLLFYTIIITIDHDNSISRSRCMSRSNNRIDRGGKYDKRFANILLNKEVGS